MTTTKELEQLRVNEEYIKSIYDKGREQYILKSDNHSEQEKSFFLTGFLSGYIEREKEIRNEL
jgi:hypothetical protein